MIADHTPGKPFWGDAFGPPTLSAPPPPLDGSQQAVRKKGVRSIPQRNDPNFRNNTNICTIAKYESLKSEKQIELPFLSKSCAPSGASSVLGGGSPKNGSVDKTVSIAEAAGRAAAQKAADAPFDPEALPVVAKNSLPAKTTVLAPPARKVPNLVPVPVAGARGEATILMLKPAKGQARLSPTELALLTGITPSET